MIFSPRPHPEVLQRVKVTFTVERPGVFTSWTASLAMDGAPCGGDGVPWPAQGGTALSTCSVLGASCTAASASVCLSAHLQKSLVSSMHGIGLPVVGVQGKAKDVKDIYAGWPPLTPVPKPNKCSQVYKR